MSVDSSMVNFSGRSIEMFCQLNFLQCSYIVLLFVSVVSTPMTTVHSVHGWWASFVSLLISSQIVLEFLWL